MTTNPDDATSAWLESLGVSIEAPRGQPAAPECGQPAPRKPPRHTEWRDTPPRFVGYCARVTVEVCECGASTHLLQGIFAEERSPLGTARYLPLSAGAQWPQGVDHKLQTITRRVPWCAHCVRGLGFTREEEL